MKTSESIIEIAKALSKFQAECPAPKKNAVNPHFRSKYSTLDEIIATVRGPLANNSLSFYQSVLTEGDQIGIRTLLLHASGEFIESDVLYLPMGKATAQAAGSSISYARRYALTTVLGVAADEDDDGNQASTPPKASQQRQSAPKQDGNIITAQQMKALGSAVQAQSEQHGMTVAQVYQDAAKECGAEGKQSNQLTRQEASKIIEYLNGMK